MADDLEDEIDPLEGTEGTGARGIARPPAASTIPPLTLRGVGGGSPQPNTETGSTEDLESRGLADHTQPRPIATPSPLEAKTTADQAELGRLQSTGSGISQIAKAHPVAGGILRGLNVAGRVGAAFLPELYPVLHAIPGTEEHHESLIRQQNSRIGEDLGEQKEQTGIGEAQARTEQAEAAGEKDRAQAAEAGQPKAKEEKWGEFNGFTDTDQTPLIREENSGQVVRASDKKPPTGFMPAKPAAQQKPDTPEQQFIDAETSKGVPLEQAVKNYAKATKQTPQEPGSFMPLYDEKGHVTGAWDPKSGRVVKNPDLPGTTTGGAAIAGKADAATKKESAPYQAMIDNATEAHQLADMAAKGNASADVDLVLSFFKMMKGTDGAGVRFTHQEQNMILGARNAGQGLVAIGQKVIGEGQPLTPEQRANMVDVMDMHAKAAQTHLASAGGAGGEGKGGANTGGTPKGATMKVPGSDGKLHWSDGKQDLGVAE